MAGTRRLPPALHPDPQRPVSSRWHQVARALRSAECRRAHLLVRCFELSYNARHWEEARYALEIRPIVGWRFGPVDLILNPIMDLPFHGGPGALTFAPADRVAYNLSKTCTLAIEHYADYGRFANFEPLGQQYQVLFGVIDYNQDTFSVEFDVGHGFTTASEPLILKLMLTRTF
jgi:hypothetical protein